MVHLLVVGSYVYKIVCQLVGWVYVCYWVCLFVGWGLSFILGLFVCLLVAL